MAAAAAFAGQPPFAQEKGGREIEKEGRETEKEGSEREGMEREGDLSPRRLVVVGPTGRLIPTRLNFYRC